MATLTVWKVDVALTPSMVLYLAALIPLVAGPDQPSPVAPGRALSAGGVS